MKSIISIIALFILSSIQAQTNFYKQFSGPGYDYAYGVDELTDSSYIVTGASSSFLDGPSQMFLLKTDSLGNLIWSKHFGESGSDIGVRVKHIENEGFLVAGYTNSSGAGAYDFALWKIDESGNEVWFKTYGTAAWEKVNDMVVTSNNGVILVGETTESIDGSTDIYLISTDASGTLIWEKKIENPGEDNAFSISKIGATRYAIGGTKFNAATNWNQAWVGTINEDGSEIWNRQWGSDQHYVIRDVTQAGTEIFSVGYLTKTDSDSSKLIISKMDGSTALETHALVENSFAEMALHVTNFEYQDAFAIGVSSKTQFSYGLEDIFFFGFTSQAQYYRTIGGINYGSKQVLGDMTTTYNRGMVAVGYNEHIGPGGSSMYIYRTGNGQPQLNSNDDFTTTSILSTMEIETSEAPFTVFPNPATTHLTIQSTSINNELYAYTIIDLNGKVLQEGEMFQTNSTIDVSNLQKGMYILQLKNTESQLLKAQTISIQ